MDNSSQESFYLQEGRYSKAETAFRSYLELYPLNAATWVNLDIALE